jgi:hypothetical protein
MRKCRVQRDMFGYYCPLCGEAWLFLDKPPKCLKKGRLEDIELLEAPVLLELLEDYDAK